MRLPEAARGKRRAETVWCCRPLNPTVLAEGHRFFVDVDRTHVAVAPPTAEAFIAYKRALIKVVRVCRHCVRLFVARLFVERLFVEHRYTCVIIFSNMETNAMVVGVHNPNFSVREMSA